MSESQSLSLSLPGWEESLFHPLNRPQQEPMAKREGDHVKWWKSRWLYLSKERILHNSDVDIETGCWIWMAHKTSGGYGLMPDTFLYAHRASYAEFVGPIPIGMNVCHKCDNPSCINPSHLFLGSHRDNTHDMLKKERGRWQKNAPHKTNQAH